VPGALEGPLFGPSSPSGVTVTSAVALPDTQATRPAPLAASDGETTACSPVRVMVTPGPSFSPSGSGTNVSALAAPAENRPTAMVAAAPMPTTRPPRNPLV